MEISSIETLLIDSESFLKTAMKRLDEAGRRVVFVLDSNSKLLGSLTDGDIRRWILSGGSLDVKVSEICNQNCFFVEQNYDFETVKQRMSESKIDVVPVVDKNHEVKDYLVWELFIENKLTRKLKQKLNHPVVIMAGGKGTRLDPLTKVLPKPLIPVGDKTILEVIIDKFREYDIDDFYLSVNHKSGIIKAYMEELSPPYKVSYVHEEKPLGTAGALKYLEGKLSLPFFVSNCDILIDADYKNIMDHHLNSGNLLTLIASIKHYSIPYGVCEIEKDELVRIQEKPEYNFLVNTGMYVLNPEVFSYIPADTFFHMTDLISAVQAAKGRVGVYPIREGSWTDTGEWDEYKKALNKIGY
ncbi:nucleotidyltransferase family protein [Leptospira limi]|uniref:Nucleotidyltransferase family protein n=1 Tax=Leptospira limi TaxID=2950023 RepID=A0ABT3LZ26_9LEPT|nr:nucleotidyltransferase family protein [Leptospira limi]MCW7462974.1 nucleotidyltransferase family protein [Leptospira limi]